MNRCAPSRTASRTNHDIQLHFDEAAPWMKFYSQALEAGTLPPWRLPELAEDLEYALKLVRDRTSRDQFILTREALGDLDAYLNQVIRDHYQTQTTRSSGISPAP